MRRLVPVVALMVLALVACGDDSDPTDSYCSDRAALQQSLTALVDLGSPDDLDTRVQAVQDDVAKLRLSAPTFATELDSVEASVTALRTLVRDADGPAAKLDAAKTGLGILTDKVQALFDAVSTDLKCD